MKAKHGIIVVLFSVLIILSGKQALSADTSAGKSSLRITVSFATWSRVTEITGLPIICNTAPKIFPTPMPGKNWPKKKIRRVLVKGQGVMRPIALNAAETKALIDYMTNDLKNRIPSSPAEAGQFPIAKGYWKIRLTKFSSLCSWILSLITTNEFQFTA